LKTANSAGTVAIPRAVATMLQRHRSRSAHGGRHDFVSTTRTGRPLSQRNVCRGLKATQERARTRDGSPTFPVLQDDAPTLRGAVPSFHGFRHTAASYALSVGDSAEEVSWLLRHKSPAVTRAIYLHEVNSVERQRRLRTRTDARYAALARAPARHRA
jgi:integrase